MDNLIALPTLNVMADIGAERQRQMEKEGWTHEHDDEHDDGGMAFAAATYAACAGEQARGWNGPFVDLPQMWPWDREWFKPRDQRRNLIRAAALLVAEIERIDRASKPLACNSKEKT